MEKTEIKGIEDLKNYVKEKENNHNFYCHYSNIENIKKIIESKYIWLSSIDNSNDLIETELIENSNECFILCFSAVNSENIPMWYLYAGDDYKCARITLKKNVFKKFRENIRVYMLTYEGGNIIKEQELVKDKDYEIRMGDVIYGSTIDEKFRIKYNAENMPNDEITEEELKEQFHYFYKELPWFYEKEYRILIQIKNKKLLDEMTNNNHIAIAIDNETNENLSICFGPEVEDKDIEKHQIFKKHKDNKSKYNGKIRFRRNKN